MKSGTWQYGGLAWVPSDDRSCPRDLTCQDAGQRRRRQWHWHQADRHQSVKCVLTLAGSWYDCHCWTDALDCNASHTASPRINSISPPASKLLLEQRKTLLAIKYNYQTINDMSLLTTEIRHTYPKYSKTFLQRTFEDHPKESVISSLLHPS